MNTAVTSLSLPASASIRPAGAGLGRSFTRIRKALWQALEAVGRARAQRHLMDFADQCEALQPELAKELRMAARQGLSA